MNKDLKEYGKGKKIKYGEGGINKWSTYWEYHQHGTFY